MTLSASATQRCSPLNRLPVGNSSFEHALLAVTRAVLGDQGVPRMRVLAQQERVHTLLRRDQPQGIRDEAGDQAPAR